jgi:hypothetical protein
VAQVLHHLELLDLMQLQTQVVEAVEAQDHPAVVLVVQVDLV